MKANLYLDPTDPFIQIDVAAAAVQDRMTGLGVTIEVTVRQDTRFTGQRPLLVIDGEGGLGEEPVG